MVVDGVIESRHRLLIPVDCDTVLLHGDNPSAISLAQRIRTELRAAGVRIAPLRDVLRAGSEFGTASAGARS